MGRDEWSCGERLDKEMDGIMDGLVNVGWVKGWREKSICGWTIGWRDTCGYGWRNEGTVG